MIYAHARVFSSAWVLLFLFARVASVLNMRVFAGAQMEDVIGTYIHQQELDTTQQTQTESAVRNLTAELGANFSVVSTVDGIEIIDMSDWEVGFVRRVQNWELWIVVVAIEHAVLLVKALLAQPDRPEWIVSAEEELETNRKHLKPSIGHRHDHGEVCTNQGV